jgi:hypothetical protein
MALRFRFFIAAAVSLIAAVPRAAVAALERGVSLLYDVIAPVLTPATPLRLATAADAPMTLMRSPLPPALQQSLRHEAGSRQRGAMRGG